MKTTFETKEQLYLLCKEICSTKYELYKENIELIKNHGATVKINYLFYHSGKYSKHPNLNKRCILMICSSIYPTTLSLSHAERTYVCQSYRSKVGTINQSDTSTYQLKINKHKDIGMTAFFKKYAKRLVKKTPNIALLRKFPIKTIIVIVLLILLFLIRLATPTGYHPSLK